MIPYGIVIWMRLKRGYIPLYTFQMDVSEGVYDDEASNFGCSPKFSDKTIYVAVDGGNPAPPWMVETLLKYLQIANDGINMNKPLKKIGAGFLPSKCYDFFTWGARPLSWREQLRKVRHASLRLHGGLFGSAQTAISQLAIENGHF